MIRHPRCFVLCGLLMLMPPVYADIAPDLIFGGISPGKRTKGSTNIAMVNERVVLDVRPHTSSTRVVFNMVNSGPAEELEIGFPERFDMPLKDFEAKMDGKSVATSVVHSPRQSTDPIHVRRWDYHDDLGYPAWYAWKTFFPEKGTHEVAVSYKTTGGLRWNIAMFNGSNKELSNVPELTPEERRSLQKMYDVAAFTYVLKTGRHWKGPISECIVEANLDDTVASRLREARPANYVRNGNKLTWTLKNFEPNEDIYLVYYGNVTRDDAVQSILSVIKNHPTSIKLNRRCAAELEAIGEREHASALLQTFFTKRTGKTPSLANRTYNDDWSDPYDLIQISKMAVECTNQTEQLSQIAPQLRSVLNDLKASIGSDNSHTETVQEIRKILGNLDARLNGKASAKVSSTAGR
jgi:hypothetical protein